MSKARSTILICAILAVLAALFVVVFMLLQRSDEPAPIVLPDAPRQTVEETPGEPEDVGFQGITTDNVLDIIAVISPAVSYARTLTVTTSWSGGSGIDIVDVCCLGDLTRIGVKHMGETKYIIYNNDEYWLWYDGDETCVSGSAGSFDIYSETRIPNYADLLSGEKEILAADYRELNGMTCVYVELAMENGSEELWIDLETGLLVKASETENGSVVYEMRQASVETPIASTDAAAEAFTLPDGTLLYHP